MIDRIEEPYIRASVITTTDYIGPIMTLCLGKRGELVKQEYISGNRVEIYYDMPLGEIVIDFYDKLKSISKGYASFDYHPNGFRPSKLVKLDILLNGEPVDALSTLTHFDNAYELGRRMCEKLKDPDSETAVRYRHSGCYRCQDYFPGKRLRLCVRT